MENILMVPLVVVAVFAWAVIIRNVLHQNRVIREHDAKRKERCMDDEPTNCHGCDVRLMVSEAHLIHPATLAVHGVCHGDADYAQCHACQSENLGTWDYCDRCFAIALSITRSLGTVLNLQGHGEEW